MGEENTLVLDTRKADRDRRVKEWFNEQRRMWIDTAVSGRPSELLVSKKLYRDLHEYAQEIWDSIGPEIHYGDGPLQGDGHPIYFRKIPIVSY